MPTSAGTDIPPPTSEPVPPGSAERQAIEAATFDFAGSGRLTRQRARLLQAALDEVAREATDVLRLWVDGLRVKAGDVEQRTVSDLLAGVVDHAVLTLPDRVDQGLLVTELALARSLVLTLLGGRGADDGPDRPLTAIETEVLDLVLVRLLECLASVLSLGPVHLGVHQFDPDAATAFDGRELMLGIPFHLTSDHFAGRVWVVLGAAALQGFLSEHERHQAPHPPTTRPQDRIRTEAVLHGVTVPVVCGFPSLRVPAGELALLQPGDVLRTGQPTGRSLVVTVGGSPLYGARAGHRGQRLVAEIVFTLANRSQPHPGGTP